MKRHSVSYQIWLERLGDPRSRLDLSNHGYSAHPHLPVPLEQRRLDSHLLWFTVDHGFAGHVDGQAVDLTPGTLSWFAPDTAHDFVIPRGVRTYRLRIRLRWHKADLTLPQSILMARNAWELRPVFEQILVELNHPQPYQQARLRQLVGSLSALTFRAQEQAQAERVLSLMQRMELQRFVAEHIRERIAPRDLADVLGISADYFSRLFKRSFGITARSWLVQERLRLAATLLVESTLNISEIARDCGFRDLNLFSRQFRQTHACSPRQFRRR